MSTFSPYCPIGEPFKISKANGIRFVYDTNGDFYYGQTLDDNILYNEDPFCGSERESFAQPFPCDGIIRLQIVWCNSTIPILGFFDTDGTIIASVAGTNIATNYYEWDLNLNDDPAFCEKCITLKILSETGENLLTDCYNGTFSTIDPGGNPPSDWAITKGYSGDLFLAIEVTPGEIKGAYYTGSKTSSNTAFHFDTPINVSGDIYYLEAEISQVSNVGVTGSNYFYLGIEGIAKEDLLSYDRYTSSDTLKTLRTYFRTSNPTIQAGLYMVGNINDELGVNIDRFKVYKNLVEATSEPIKVSAYHKCLVKIEYWNNDAYDNIDYSFGYRNILYVPATLGMAKFPEESKVYQKSNGTTLKLSGRIKKVTPFKTDYIPQYLHEKMAILFSHDNIEINGTAYVKEGEYAIDEIEKYTLAQGGTDLTKTIYNYLNSNCD